MASNVTYGSTGPLPVVTEGDINEFHRTHFSSNSAKLRPERSIPAIETAQREEEEYVEYEDDLGYYPDGVKRTLTDEQIAIFRHSEIESILRRRRHEDEEIEARKNNENGALDGVADRSQRGDIKDAVETASLEAEPTGRLIQVSKKRKRSSKSQQGRESKGFTYRRLAREQDEQEHSATDLDYGGSESTPSTKPLAATSGEVKDQEPRIPSNSTSSGFKQSNNVASRFIWPTLHG